MAKLVRIALSNKALLSKRVNYISIHASQSNRHFSFTSKLIHQTAAHKTLSSDEFFIQLADDLKNDKPVRAGRKAKGSQPYQFTKEELEGDPECNHRLARDCRSLARILKKNVIDLETAWTYYLRIKTTRSCIKESTEPLPIQIYDALIEFLFHSKYRDDAENIRELIVDKSKDGYLLSERDCVKFSYASFALKKENEMLDFLADWIDSGNEPSLRIMNLAMQAYWMLGDLGNCLEAFQAIRKTGLVPNNQTYRPLIGAYLSKSNFVKAREYAAEMFAHTKVGESDFDFVVTTFANCDDWYGTRRVLELWAEKKQPPNLKTLTTLIRASMRNYQLSKRKSLKDPKGRSEEVTVIDTIYHGLCRSRIPLDKVSFCAFISWYVFTGFTNKAEGVLRDMIKSGQVPDLREYSILIKGYSLNEQWDEVLLAYNTIKEKDLGMNEACYGSIVKALHKLRGEDPHKYLSDLKNGTLAPTTIVFNICLDLFCRQGDFSKAYQVYEYMLEMKVEPNLFTYTQFFEGMCLLRQEVTPTEDKWEAFRISTLDIFKKIFNELKARSFQGDLPLYNMIINSFSYLDDLDQAQEVYEYLTHFLSITPDSFTYFPIARATVTGIDPYSAVRTIRASLDSNHSRLLYCTFINGFCLGRETSKAVHLYRVMTDLASGKNGPRVKGLPTLDAASFTKLIHCCLKELDFTTALEILKDLHASEIPLSFTLLHTLFKHLKHLESQPMISQLQELLLDMFHRLPIEDQCVEVDDFPEDEWQGKATVYNNFKHMSIDVYLCLLEISKHSKINLSPASMDADAMLPRVPPLRGD